MIGKEQLYKIPSQDEEAFFQITDITNKEETSALVYIIKKYFASAIGYEGLLLRHDEHVLVDDDIKPFIFKVDFFFCRTI